MNINIEKLISNIESALDHHLTWTAQSRYIGGANIEAFLPESPSAIGESIRAVYAYGQAGKQGDDRQRGEILEAIQGICETLFSCAWSNGYNIPDGFWNSELGSIISVAQSVALGDELITLTEAGILLGRKGKLAARLNYVADQIAKGKLDEFIDPSERNPTRARRVKKSQVLKLKAELGDTTSRASGGNVDTTERVNRN